jgi:hypothetical protein
MSNDNDNDNELHGNWRSFSGYTFISSFDFEDGQETTLEIIKVTLEDAIDPITKNTKKLISLILKGTDRIMALNKTNAKRITELTGTHIVDKWKGFKITIIKKPIKCFGKDQFCLRIK